MKGFWTPSSTFVSVEPANSATLAIASNQVGGAIRVFNVGASNTAIVAVVSAAATVGEANYVPVAPIGDNIAFFVYSGLSPKVLVSNSTCFINVGYMV